MQQCLHVQIRTLTDQFNLKGIRLANGLITLECQHVKLTRLCGVRRSNAQAEAADILDSSNVRSR